MFNFHQLAAYAAEIGIWLGMCGVLGVLVGWYFCRPKGWRLK
jgi:hypothetical protein